MGARRGSKRRICNIFGKAYRIKMKHPGYSEGDIQQTKRQHVHATTVTSVSPTTSIATTCKAQITINK